ncbi:MAG: TolC family protein [Planctomycetota bacterium]
MDATSTLVELVERALAVNPGLRAARERWIAACEELPQATSLPDPTLAARWFVEEVQTRVGPQEWSLGVRQQLPWFGTLDARGDVADGRAAAAGARHGAEFARVIADVKKAWADLFLLERSIETVRGNRDLLADMEDVARSRYGSGRGTYADVVRVQVELDKLSDRLRSLEGRRTSAGAHLNALLHRPPTAALPAPTSIDAERPLPPAEALRAELHASSPRLHALRLEADAAGSAVELTQLAQRPSWTVGLEYIATGEAPVSGVSGSGDDPLIASVQVDLPLRRARDRAEERQARALHRAAQGELERAENAEAAALEHQLYLARDGAERIALYRSTLVPRARQSYEVIATAFRAGEAGFLDLVEAERELLTLELSLESARTERARAVAELERLIGGPLPGSEVSR